MELWVDDDGGKYSQRQNVNDGTMMSKSLKQLNFHSSDDDSNQQQQSGTTTNNVMCKEVLVEKDATRFFPLCIDDYGNWRMPANEDHVR